MKRYMIAAALALLAVPCLSQEVIRLDYDYSSRRLSCGNPAAECDRRPAADDSIVLRVCGAPVGILELEAKPVERPGFTLTDKQARALGIIPASPGTGTTGGESVAGRGPLVPAEAPTPEEIVAAYHNLENAVRGVANWVANPTGAENFTLLQAELANAHEGLLGLLQSARTPAAIVRALNEKLNGEVELRLGVSETELLAWFGSEIDLNNKAALGLGCYNLGTFPVEVPFDINLEWKSTNPLVKKPQGDSIPILFPTWKIAGSTGFAFSGLTDDHYTVRTVTVTPAQGTTPAVTKRIGVQEDEDDYRPEVTGFVHFTRFGGWGDGQGMSRFWPSQISVGGGLSSALSGRVYLGGSWPFGRVGSFTLGVAGGQVKRLSKNVDLNDLGTTDPEATRRDVIRTSIFFGVSWRVIGAENQ